LKIRAVMLALLLTFFTSSALAAETKCPQHYFDGQAPNILNEKLKPKTQEICYQNYALKHSGISRTPLFSAEHLIAENLNKPHARRKTNFHPDPNLSPEDRAELEDYAYSGYDRGHLSPAGDMPDEKAQDESFSLANMIPQNPFNNRYVWEAIEEATRDLAKTSGELYVITGPIFYGSALKRLNGRVLVPTYIFKAIYDPSRKQAAAYLVANAEGERYTVISIAELEGLTGISLFPALANAAKKSPMALPTLKSTNKTFIEDKSIVPKKSSS
jgi:endonuclease G